MDSQIQALLSNQVEQLYLQLKERLFSNCTNPFTKRLIVVPSPAMKAWVMQRLADDLGIAAGIKVIFLEPAIKWIQESLLKKSEQSFIFPSRLELALSIEKEITSIVESCNEEIWDPLVKHIKGDESCSLSRREERRIVALASQLAALFAQYEKYGRLMLKEWQSPRVGGWQEALWRRVLNRMGSDQLEWNTGNVTIHIFALSYLSCQQHQLFTGLSAHIPVSYYLLSPCEIYWSDLLSDRESIRLHKRWEQLGLSEYGQIEADEILFDRNPLLANWGKLGRMMAAQMEDTVGMAEVYYQGTDEDLSLLEGLQSDFLLLRNCKNLPTRYFEKDRSLQLHVATSKMREVEAVYNSILKVIDTHHEDENPICPKDVIVMAPNIMEYEPYIRAVFHESESLLDCQIMDLQLLTHNDVVQGFMQLIRLPQSRWDSQSILQLFECASFQERHQLSSLDVKKIMGWIKDSKIRWGSDSQHRSELLLKNHCNNPMSDLSETGTWKHGQERLLLGMAMIAPSDDSARAEFNQLPLNEVSSTEQELLGRWIHITQTMREDLRPLGDGSKKKLKEWSEYLIYLLNRYFAWSRLGEAEQDQVEQLMRAIHGLAEISSLKDDLYGFVSIQFHLEEALSQKRVCYRENHWQAVRFCSMLPMRALPAKVVVLMGMEEENYPRRDAQFSLNQLYHHPNADPFPTATDFDRYLFLEAMLSARQYFLISYSHPTHSEGKEGSPSLLVSELFSYLDRGFEVGGLKPSEHCTYKHPFFPFDQSYFSRDTEVPAYSQMHYRAAVSFYHLEKQKKHAFVPEFYIENARDDSIEIIDIKQLVQLARNPIAFYFNQSLGMYLGKEDDNLIRTDEAFMISAIDNARFKKDALKSSFKDVVENAEVEGRLPVGPFKSYAVNRMRCEHEEWFENLQRLGCDPDQIFSVECSENNTAPLRMNKKWLLPPLEVIVNGKTIRIVGNLPEVCEEGLIAYLKEDKREVAKVWPQYLVWCQLIHHHSFPYKKQLLFIKNGKCKNPDLNDYEKPLEEYLKYYLLARENISPLIPEWIPEFVESSPEKFQKKVDQTFSEYNMHFYNEYMRWMVKGSETLSSDKMFRDWKEVADKVFGEMIDQWKKVKK